MADIAHLPTPLRKRREEWLKVRTCPKCGKPANMQKFSDHEHYSHFENGVYVGWCKVPTKTKRAGDTSDNATVFHK